MIVGLGIEALDISRPDPFQGLQRNATRRILHVGVERVAAATNTLPELLCVSILGESLLYRMVRYIVSKILLGIFLVVWFSKFNGALLLPFSHEVTKKSNSCCKSSCIISAYSLDTKI